MGEFNICHLYPRQMSLYGDRGNILVLLQRARWRGLEVNLQACETLESIDPKTNLIFLGGGQDLDQSRIIADLFSKKNQIKGLIENGAVLLAICGGYQLIGGFYETVQERIEGLGLLDINTYRAAKGKKRFIGNLITESSLFGKLWGFENHGGRTYLGDGLEPLGRVIQGHGNNGSDQTEGVLTNYGDGLIMGTYMHTFLPKNIQVADYLIQKACQLDSLDPLNDNIENENRKYGLKLRY